MTKIWTDKYFRATKVLTDIVLTEKAAFVVKVKVTFMLQWYFDRDF